MLPGDRLAPTAGQKRRQAILDAIEGLLHEESIETLSIGQIAKRAGITRSRFYVYFDSKYTALAVVLANSWGEMGPLSQNLMAGPGDQHVERYLRDTVTGVVAGWRRHAAVYVAFYDSRFSDPALGEMWRSWTNSLADGVTEMLRRERDRGTAHPADRDIRLVVDGLLSMTQQLIYDSCRGEGGDPDVHRTIDMLTSIWLASAWGIRVGERSEEFAERQGGSA